MKTLQKIGYASFATFALAETAFAQINFGNEKVQSGLRGSSETADSAVQKLITNAMIFLAIIAVCYGLYGGFLILTAGGDDGKVKQGKTILIQVAIGLIVIFLANSLVQFVLTQILK